MLRNYLKPGNINIVAHVDVVSWSQRFPFCGGEVRRPRQRWPGTALFPRWPEAQVPKGEFGETRQTASCGLREMPREIRPEFMPCSECIFLEGPMFEAVLEG